MNRVWKELIAILVLLIMTGCGGGGTSGNGTTVYVTAAISNNTAGSVFGNMSSLHTIPDTVVFAANPMSITLTSHVYNQTGNVPVSTVSIDRLNLTLTPLPYTSIPPNTTNALSPAIPNPQYANNPQGVGGVIPAPGSLKIDGIPILGLSDGALMFSAFSASGLSSVQYHYVATLAFHCVEANTGAQFLVTQPVGVEVELP